MKRKFELSAKSWVVIYLFILCGICLFAGCRTGSGSTNTRKREKTTPKTKETISYTSVTIPMDKDSQKTLVYNPVDHVLTQIRHKGQTYIRSTWQPEKGWTSNLDSWKLKKHETLENFTYNTNGALYACRKKWKRGALTSQTLVHLRSHGKINQVRLTKLNQLSSEGTSSHKIPEIMDLQCSGTSIAITYQYGAVKIYNLAEGQALGASFITGTPGKNIFYNLHYITIQQPENKNDILLRDYDIRSGEITHSFPLGGPDQDSSVFHVSSCRDDLYVLTSRGLFGGQCSDTSLIRLLAYNDLKLPEQSHVTYLQADGDNSLFWGFQTKEGDFVLRHITLPENMIEESPQGTNKDSQVATRI